MERSSAAEIMGYIPISNNDIDILKRSRALNESLGVSYPLVISFMMGFDEAVNNMRIYTKLLAYEEGEEFEELSNHDLFICCFNQKLIEGKLGDWLFYQALRKKITPALDTETVDEIIKVSPKFCNEINSMILKLEQKLKQYRTLN